MYKVQNNCKLKQTWYALLEASVSCNHPFQTSFGKNNNIFPRFVTEFSQAFSKMFSQDFHFCEGFPFVISHVVLKLNERYNTVYETRYFLRYRFLEILTFLKTRPLGCISSSSLMISLVPKQRCCPCTNTTARSILSIVLISSRNSHTWFGPGLAILRTMTDFSSASTMRAFKAKQQRKYVHNDFKRIASYLLTGKTEDIHRAINNCKLFTMIIKRRQKSINK